MPGEALVFVIDDDPMVLRSLELLFDSVGMPTETLPSSTSFLQRPYHDGPFCLVLDLGLPDLDGLTVQQRLAEAGVFIPIVFLSGQADVPSTARAMRDGAVDFLVKPVHDGELLDAVSRALARRTRRGGVTVSRPRPQSASHGSPRASVRWPSWLRAGFSTNRSRPSCKSPWIPSRSTEAA